VKLSPEGDAVIEILVGLGRFVDFALRAAWAMPGPAQEAGEVLRQVRAGGLGEISGHPLELAQDLPGLLSRAPGIAHAARRAKSTNRPSPTRISITASPSGLSFTVSPWRGGLCSLGRKPQESRGEKNLEP
jgi:hypothetical protein